jgi:hypothetical protein
MSIDATTERPGSTTERPSALQQGRPGVPWSTVVPLAVVMAYADGFWLTSLRGAVSGSEGIPQPFAHWLRESALVLPVFVFAVLGVLTLALRWFGPVLRKPRTVVATVLLIVAAGTVVGLAATVASSAYDYHLESIQLRIMHSMPHGGGMGTFEEGQQRALALHVGLVIYISRWLLLTNLVLVVGVVAMRGGRLKVATTRRAHDGRTDTARMTGSSRVEDMRLLLVAALVASAAIHAAVVPELLTEWTAAGLFFLLLMAGELAVAGAVAGMLLTRLPRRTVLLAAAVVSVGPLVLWLYSRTAGLPFGPDAGVPEGVGLPDSLAGALGVASLLTAVVLLRATGWLGRPPASAHVRALVLVALIAVTAIGVAGTGPSWFDVFGIPGGQSVMDMPH